eukprot:4273966-Alexandrium_andersonii.AAC.1
MLRPLARTCRLRGPSRAKPQQLRRAAKQRFPARARAPPRVHQSGMPQVEAGSQQLADSCKE